MAGAAPDVNGVPYGGLDGGGVVQVRAVLCNHRHEKTIATDTVAVQDSAMFSYVAPTFCWACTNMYQQEFRGAMGKFVSCSPKTP